LTGILKKKSWLLPLVLTGLLVSFLLTARDWNVNNTYLQGMLVVDYFSVVFNSIMILSTFVIFLFAFRYYKGVERPLDDIFAVMIFALFGSVLMTSFTNLIMLFIGIETLSIALYILAGSHKEAITSNEATLKYFLLGSFLSGFMLFGIALLYGASGSFDLTGIQNYVMVHLPSLSILFIAGLFLLIIGLAFKIAIFPFHFWTPDVYEGTPTLLTAFMATVVKVAGFAAMYRFFSFIFYGIHGIWEPTLMILSALTILLANLTGLYQSSMKRMLAYSSIAHSGYMMLALLAFSSRTPGALVLYAAAYSLATITSFGILILIRESFGNDQFKSFNGLARNNPTIAVVLTIAMFSLTGIPPLAGFMAKYMLFTTALEQKIIWPVIVAIAGSAISIGYYFKPVIAMYFRNGEGTCLMTSVSFRLILIVLTLLIIGLGLAPFILTDLI
jgi:NADH-quinone oxidoreductase subunit N